MDFHVHKRFVIAITMVLGAILLVLCGLFVFDYFTVTPARVIDPSRFSELGKNHVPLGSSDVSMIAPWMTFNYINYVFALPAGYLKTALGITDARYPNLVLSRYAREHGIAEDTFMTNVENAVQGYFAQSQAQ